jgi:hypothetical protein
MAKKPASAEKKTVQVVEKKKIKIKGGKAEETKKVIPAKKEIKKEVKKEAPKKVVAAKPVKKAAETPKKSQAEPKGDRLPGQKHDTPEEGDGSRIFYESLLK